MNYLEAVNYIENLEKFGSKFGLETISSLLDRLYNPQKDLKFINIAGTNGKGSVSAFLTSIFVASGYKTGTFNSPSVFSYNERYLLNNKPIDNESVAKYLTIVKDVRDEMEKEGLDLPTAFEIEFAAAMLYFKDQKCNMVILEAGLGGRYDATNVVENKKLAIITSISLDHTAILGKNLRQIASEKFGIVKDDLVTFEQPKEVMGVFRKAKNLYIANECEELSYNEDGQTFMYNNKVYLTKMLGAHQLQNLSIVLKAVDVLRQKGYNLPAKAVDEGIKNTVWPGRCQKFNYKGKIVILDGAHNPDGAKCLKETILRHFKNYKKSFVFGVFKDKDYNGILDKMNHLADNIYVSAPKSPRALPIEDAKVACEGKFINIYTAPTITQALDVACKDDSEVIVVFGSLSILQEAKSFLED